MNTLEIPEDLLASAMSYLVGHEYFVPSYNQKFHGYRQDHTKRTVDVSSNFLTALTEEIKAAAPFCDHSVGICQCAVISALKELDLILQGLKYCPDCNGEGSVEYRDDDYVRCERCVGGGIIDANPSPA